MEGLKSWSIPILAAGVLLGAAAHAAAQLPATADRIVTVWLKLADDPVAIVRSRAPGRRLSPEAEKTLVAQLRSKQQALIPSIEANGGKFFFDLGNDAEKENFERKFKDPDGVIFDVSKHGWVGTERER